jgi:hypothetical protein
VLYLPETAAAIRTASWDLKLRGVLLVLDGNRDFEGNAIPEKLRLVLARLASSNILSLHRLSTLLNIPGNLPVAQHGA